MVFNEQRRYERKVWPYNTQYNNCNRWVVTLTLVYELLTVLKLIRLSTALVTIYTDAVDFRYWKWRWFALCVTINGSHQPVRSDVMSARSIPPVNIPSARRAASVSSSHRYKRVSVSAKHVVYVLTFIYLDKSNVFF